MTNMHRIAFSITQPAESQSETLSLGFPLARESERFSLSTNGWIPYRSQNPNREVHTQVRNAEGGHETERMAVEKASIPERIRGTATRIGRPSNPTHHAEQPLSTPSRSDWVSSRRYVRFAGHLPRKTDTRNWMVSLLSILRQVNRDFSLGSQVSGG